MINFHSSQGYASEIQEIALINELKGNLFEYLVGLELAKFANISKNFSISNNTEMKNRLMEYEDWLKFNCPELLVRLPELSKICAQKLFLNINVI